MPSADIPTPVRSPDDISTDDISTRAIDASDATCADNLPAWDLSDLYAAPNAPELLADLDRGMAMATAFAHRWSGKLAACDGAQLAQAIAEYEVLDELLGRLATYGQLLFAADASDPAISRFYQSINEHLTAIGTHTLFFGLELNRLDDDWLQARLQDPTLARWKPWLRDLRVFRPHQLSDEAEKILHEKNTTSAGAWIRLFDETLAALRVPVNGEQMTVANALNQLSDPDRTKRQQASEGIGETFKQNIRLFSLITNTLIKDKSMADDWRGYETPGSYRNRSNMVEDEVVQALMDAVVASYPRLSHRYYQMKAKWLGLEKLQTWDRNAPLPDAADRCIAWDEARDQVLNAYNAFSPSLGAIGQRFFDNAWIDAGLRPGKDGGAFSHPGVPSVHPYILTNYHGRMRDVMTLAHELGHGVHQVLAGEQGYLMSATPLTLAETASVFGEMLTFRNLLNAETDPALRRIMLAGKVEDMLNTVVRQIAFYRFETKLHDERRSGEVTADRISEIWLDVQKESLGPAFEFADNYRSFWAYVPHFVHSPFYVYAYAFGDCLVNALYGVYQDGHPGFEEKYMDMLRSGGTKRHQELLAPFGLDASDPNVWARGLDVISGFIDELEGL
jgi:oligoendopeptidase F